MLVVNIVSTIMLVIVGSMVFLAKWEERRQAKEKLEGKPHNSSK